MMNSVNNVDSVDIVGTIKDLCELYDTLQERCDFLSTQISLCDKAICDIEHAAEFFNLNAARGYNLYKQLHDVCVRRRAYKLEQQKIEILLGNNINAGNVKNIAKKINKVIDFDAAKYEPRVLVELFES